MTRSLEAKIGILLFIFCFIFFLYNLIGNAVFNNISLLDSFLKYINVSLLLLFAILFAMSSKPGKTNQIVQVITLFVVGAITILQEGYENKFSFFGIAFYVYAFLLGLEYKLFVKQFFLKTIFVIVSFIILLGFAFFEILPMNRLINFLIQRIIFIIGFVMGLYLLYWDSIKEYLNNRKTFFSNFIDKITTLIFIKDLLRDMVNAKNIDVEKLKYEIDRLEDNLNDLTIIIKDKFRK